MYVVDGAFDLFPSVDSWVINIVVGREKGNDDISLARSLVIVVGSKVAFVGPNCNEKCRLDNRFDYLASEVLSSLLIVVVVVVRKSHETEGGREEPLGVTVHAREIVTC